MRTRAPLKMLLLLLLLALGAAAQQPSGATGKQGKAAAATASSGQAQKSQPATEDPSYVIGPEDVLDVSVWKEADFSRTVPVRPDGKISLPLLNDIQADGLTPMQLAASITEVLRKYVTNPQVTVIVTTINSRRVYVLGEVNRPGPIPLLHNMTVLQALSSAGGFTQFANQKEIQVVRNEGGRQLRYRFNYKEAVRGRAGRQNIVLKPGDSIVVP